MKNKTGPKRTDPSGELRQRCTTTILDEHKRHLQTVGDAKPYFDLGISFAIIALEQGEAAALDFVSNHFKNRAK